MRWTLDRADYRRRVAELYLSPPTEGVEGWEAFRRARDELFGEHPQSPLTPEQRASFGGLRFFDHDAAYRVSGPVEEIAEGSEIVMDTGGDDGVIRCRRVCSLPTPFGSLTLFWLTGYGGGLFLPFRDGTSGRESYGGGRYLTDTIKGTFGRGLQLEGDRIVLDFNYAYNPSCAYNSLYACPLAPRENRLDAPVRAGELVFPNPS
jgi:uncharacterized protein (DUF1684 family)